MTTREMVDKAVEELCWPEESRDALAGRVDVVEKRFRQLAPAWRTLVIVTVIEDATYVLSDAEFVRLERIIEEWLTLRE